MLCRLLLPAGVDSFIPAREREVRKSLLPQETLLTVSRGGVGTRRIPIGEVSYRPQRISVCDAPSSHADVSLPCSL
jgi:hypothetical protein